MHTIARCQLKLGVICFVFLLLLLSSNVALVRSDSWSEITRIIVDWGTAPNIIKSYQTGNFTCSHAEWRIVWNCTPLSINPEDAAFNILIYRTNETNYITSMNQQGNTTTNGTMYIHNHQGEFYLKFLVINLRDSTAVIEQDIESIPEFSPMFPLSLLTVGISVAMILARREVRLRSRSQRQPRTFDRPKVSRAR